jgi:hypothetical protein
MSAINNVFLIVLLVLGVFSGVGYLVNETADLRQQLAEKDARIVELEA